MEENSFCDFLVPGVELALLSISSACRVRPSATLGSPVLGRLNVFLVDIIQFASVQRGR